MDYFRRLRERQGWSETERDIGFDELYVRVHGTMHFWGFVFRPDRRSLLVCDSCPEEEGVRGAAALSMLEVLFPRWAGCAGGIQVMDLPRQPIQLDGTSCGVIWQETLRSLLVDRTDLGCLDLGAPARTIGVEEGMLGVRERILLEMQRGALRSQDAGEAGII